MKKLQEEKQGLYMYHSFFLLKQITACIFFRNFYKIKEKTYQVLGRSVAEKGLEPLTPRV